MSCSAAQLSFLLTISLFQTPATAVAQKRPRPGGISLLLLDLMQQNLLLLCISSGTASDFACSCYNCEPARK